jgi:signal transduction histidine kinase
MNGQRKVLLLLAIVVDAFLIFFLVRSVAEYWNSKQKYDFSVLRESSGSVYVCDANADGQDDILQLDAEGPFPSQKMLRLFSPFIPAAHLRYKFFFEIPVSRKAVIGGMIALEPSGPVTIPVLDVASDQVVLTLLDLNGKPLETIKLPIFEPRPKQDTGIPILEFEDLNGDGCREAILAVNSSYSLSPRGIVAYDLKQRRILWQYPCGCSPISLRVVDVNDDGRKEIVFSGWSPHNGASVNGTDDDRSYIIVLDSTGKEINKLVLGGYYTMVYFDTADINGDGLLEIVTAKGSHQAERNPEPGEIRILNGSTLETLKYVADQGIGFSNVFFIKSDESDFMCVVGDSAGRLSLYDWNLRLKHRTNLDFPAIVRGVIPLGVNSQKPLVLVEAGFKQLWFLDQRLDLMQNFISQDFGEAVETKVMGIRNGAQYAALLSAGRLYLISEKAGFTSGVWPFLKSSLAAGLAVILVFNAFLWLAIKSIKAAASEKGQAAENRWSEAAQEIVHRMKSQLFTIQLEAEKLKSLSEGDGWRATVEDVTLSSASILDDVADLKRRIRSVMKLLEMRPLQPIKVEPARIIETTIRHYQELLKGKIEFKLEMDDDGGQTHLDETLFIEALSNIIENSVEALPRGGWIRIAMTVIYSPVFRAKKALEIEVEDNGQGIPPDKLNEIFQPYYSTKTEGAGIGLTIARRIVEAHGGRINVQSKEGIGTRLAIVLPWKG